MLDTATLRVAFGVTAVCVLVLFYGVTYRTTRSAYSRWWCISLGLFVVSALLFLFNDTGLQVVANPMGNTLAVLGASGVWAAARSLRGQTLAVWQLLLAPGIVMAASFLDDPAGDVWTGGAAFLAGMAAMLGLSSWELQNLRRTHSPAEGDNAQFGFAVASLAIGSGAVAVYYLFRALAFVAVGPDHDFFAIAFGSQTTTLLTMALLVVVTFSMSALSHDQQTRELRDQAIRDGLTNVLNRAEFMRRADTVFRRAKAGEPGGAVMVADLDRFKEVNDSLGHAAGDRTLVDFAGVCRAVVGDDGFVGRLGGDEFAVLLTDRSRAELVADEISRRFRSVGGGTTATTVSFGIAAVDPGVGVKDTIIRADLALYRAKAAGRDRVMRYDVAG